MNKRTSKRWQPWLLSVIATLSFACSSDGTSMNGTDVPPTPPPTMAKPSVLFSEVMYHPVMENAYVENHEFIELYNRSDAAVDLSGWQLTGAVQFAFPAGTQIAAKGYVVIAKNKAALVSVSSYNLSTDRVLGDYAGELDNGGAVVNLVDPSSVTQDSFQYTDQFPWSIGADALGADDEWLALLPTPITSAPHQYKGISLQRVSYDVPTSELSNWVPSPLDGANPGQANGQSGPPPTIVTRKTVTPTSGNLVIGSADTVKVSVVFSTLAPFTKPQLQWFVDDLQATGEPVTTVDLQNNNGFYEATVPKQPNNSIVRYRILVDKGSGSEVISPRPSDPLTHWAYFVSPPAASTAPAYNVFIKKENWNQMYDNVNWPTPDDKRVTPGGSSANRCMLRASWDAMVPAVFVSDGVVYDVMTRYEGSRWNRTNGIGFDITKTTINPRADRPANTILSWKVDFPNYAQFEGKRGKMVLNKLNQACPGLDDAVGQLIYGDPSVNVPVQRAKFVRLNLNGGYYHYMLDIEHIDGDMMKRYRAPGERVGDLFKADGNAGAVEGPWGVSDETTLGLNTTCPQWTIDDRYKYTYDRKTYNWDNNKKLQTTIETLNTLRAAAVASGDYTALKAFLVANFDTQKMIDYIAIRNWAEPWDEGFHNHFLYQRASDGKWLLIPQDKDREWGEALGWQGGRSFFWGEEGNGQYNRWKDAFIKVFRNELRARLLELDATGVLNPASWKSKVLQAATTFSISDYVASPAAASICNFYTELQGMQTFGDYRHNDVLDFGDEATCTATTCGLKADMYQTAAGDTTRDFAKATLKTSKVTPTVNYDWTSGTPDPLVPADNFQIRWTGKVVPRYSETYTFFTQADDGVRLWVNGVQVINNWATQTGTVETSGTIALTAGTPVTVTLEYFEGTGNAAAKLLWQSASVYKQIIPTGRLRPM